MRPGSDLSRPFSIFDFSSRRAIVAAVSGGSDSTALLLLLKSFLEQNAPATRLVAVTIDHALRPASAAEAEQAAHLAALHGISHRTLVWTGEKPAAGLPAAAREARYSLLAGAARDEGADLIFTGHTADDQAETVMMRQARGDGIGLAGMAPATLFESAVWIARPLLQTSRETLRAYLRERDIRWSDDPTNSDAAFERPRIRQAIGDAGETQVAEALETARAASQARENLGRRAALRIAAFADRPSPGLVRLSRDFAAPDDREGAVHALRILLGCVGGATHLPDHDRTAHLFDRLAGERLCATLSRTVVDARRSGIFLRREARDPPPPTVLRESMNWDGRYRIASGRRDLSIAPHGVPDAAFETASGVPDSLVRAALATQPALWRDGQRLCLLPNALTDFGVEATPLAGPWARFLPSFDLAPAHAVAKLLGAPLPPAPPFASHIIGLA
ncbi:MAG: tRNA lysidine(34) synthetase TilS [Pseudaminobacter sp.]|nr:tRNA lysidine(34) synthetase TilS [Pseudaminobacter sp.]